MPMLALFIALLGASLASAESALPGGARSHVVVVHDPNASTAFIPNNQQVAELVIKGLEHISGKKNDADIWRTYVSPSDVVGVKVHASPGPASGTRPIVVETLVRSLLRSGHPATNIVIWDRRMIDLRTSGFKEIADRLGVRLAAAMEEGYDPEVFYEHPVLGKLVWGDLEFGKQLNDAGRKSYVSTLLTKTLTKVINVTPLLNHNVAGVAGNLYTLSMASIDNNFRFQADSTILANTAPEIYALPEIGDKVVLNIVDALICQYQGEETIAFHYASPLNELRLSKDPIALDMLSIHELNRQRQAAGKPLPKPPFDLFENAALLEIGNNDVRKISLEYIGPPRAAGSNTNSSKGI